MKEHVSKPTKPFSKSAYETSEVLKFQFQYQKSPFQCKFCEFQMRFSLLLGGGVELAYPLSYPNYYPTAPQIHILEGDRNEMIKHLIFRV
ncbi:hypothetical protein B9Z55_021480 [Caenorhabditis nigoni]|uniref:Uncharacterized protein n=1 Tax=Caenorhabditis nigoni TaxID=1611254 RepID=A0A2G5TS85_9PELO|nr:hypothetical protein B9Z55_021480 [Caenorhabditis nigoni]